MKTLKLYTIGLLLATFFSCQIAEEIDDYNPLYVLDAESAINNEAAAEQALTGIYGGYNGESRGTTLYLVGSAFYGTGTNTTRINHGWQINAPAEDGEDFYIGMYTMPYKFIANCNNLITSINNNLTDADFANPDRRTEILAEARAMRGYQHLILLTTFGEWYNTGSEYGIAIKTEENTTETNPRNTVAEVYAQIEADLDYAIANAPATSAKTRMSQVFAKAIKARVKLLQADYQAAATLALDVMNNSGANYGLTPTFSDMFDNTSTALYSLNEQIYITSSSSFGFPGPGMGGNTLFAVGANLGFQDVAENTTITVGGQVINIDDNTARVSELMGSGFFGAISEKYFNQFGGDTYDAIFHMRMSEVYLIYAEASARANVSVTAQALTALNAVRTRVGATTTGADGFETYPATITYAQFLDAVRLEKVVELWGESGQEWQDLVRIAYQDGGFDSGFKVSDVKAEATNPDFFILPIPQGAIEGSEGVISPNPGY